MAVRTEIGMHSRPVQASGRGQQGDGAQGARHSLTVVQPNTKPRCACAIASGHPLLCGPPTLTQV